MSTKTSRKPIPETSRECAECGSTFRGKGRGLTCSPKCRKERSTRQLREDYQRKVAANPKKGKVCASCRKDFLPLHSQEKYCSDKCRAEGFLQKIADQKARRTREKTLRNEAKTRG